ncbi:hypothetical protein P171DRAFT_137261 [Karstenula rhodostoma CBS 690.94]|uniref:Uncharacterized protein n=1 Tax=Karstenula rhodostoma CBS 690.94 TaxID=1392251 RepID=A0A9P4PS19_9PLEO|nr:hypothetical protein P171DRAFT_137261 [Karstenula rhodostoma CBS 690.94]
MYSCRNRQLHTTHRSLYLPCFSMSKIQTSEIDLKRHSITKSSVYIPQQATPIPPSITLSSLFPHPRHRTFQIVSQRHPPIKPPAHTPHQAIHPPYRSLHLPCFPFTHILPLHTSPLAAPPSPFDAVPASHDSLPSPNPPSAPPPCTQYNSALPEAATLAARPR